MEGITLLDIQLYGIFFLLGAFTVKSLSEMMNWSGRRDMSELWLIFLLGFIIHDTVLRPYRIRYSVLKWGVIAAVALFFLYKDVFFIVRDDKLALMAAMSVLPPIAMFALLGIYVLSVFLFKRRLRHTFSHSRMIPTMPVLTTALIMSLLISYYIP